MLHAMAVNVFIKTYVENISNCIRRGETKSDQTASDEIRSLLNGEEIMLLSTAVAV